MASFYNFVQVSYVEPSGTHPQEYPLHIAPCNITYLMQASSSESLWQVGLNSGASFWITEASAKQLLDLLPRE